MESRQLLPRKPCGAYFPRETVLKFEHKQAGPAINNRLRIRQLAHKFEFEDGGRHCARKKKELQKAVLLQLRAKINPNNHNNSGKRARLVEPLEDKLTRPGHGEKPFILALKTGKIKQLVNESLFVAIVRLLARVLTTPSLPI